MTNVMHKFFSMYLFIYNSLHVSNTSCSSSGETDCINTASGSCHSVLVAVSCAGWSFAKNHSSYMFRFDHHHQGVYYLSLLKL